MYNVPEKVEKFITEARKIARGKNLSRGKNPEWRLPGRCPFAIAMCYGNDANQLHFLLVLYRIHIYKITRKF